MTDWSWLEPTGDPEAQKAAAVPSPFARKGEDEVSTIADLARPREELKPKGLFEVLGDTDIRRLPFVGTAVEADNLMRLVGAARRVQDGYGTLKDLRMLDAWVREQERGRTFFGAVADVALEIPKFGIEFMATAGVGSAGKVVAKKTAEATIHGSLKAAVKARAIKAATARQMAILGRRKARQALATRAGRMAGGAAAAATDVAARVTAMEGISQFTAHLFELEEKGGIISASAARKALGRGEWERDEFGRFQLLNDAVVPTTLEMLDRGFVDSMIQVGSEMVGGRLLQASKTKLGKLAEQAGIHHVPLLSKVKALQLEVLNKWVSQSGQRSIQKAMQIMEKGGWHGILGEVLEERAAGVGELGAELFLGMGQDFDGMDTIFPSIHDLAVELAAFSVPSLGVTGAVAGKELVLRTRSGLPIGTREAEAAARNRGLSDTGANDENTVSAGVHTQAAGAVKTPMMPKGPVTPAADRPTYLQEPSYKIKGGKLTEEEQEALLQDLAFLGGRAREQASRLEQVDIGFGASGTTLDTSARGDAADPVGIEAVMDSMYTNASMAGAAYQATVAKGRMENVESWNERNLQAEEYIDGVNLRTMHAQIGRANNLSDAAFKASALMVANLWLRKKGNPNQLLPIKDIFLDRSRAHITDEVFRELRAAGSINRPGSDRFEQALHGLLEFLRMHIMADGTAYMPATSKWFKETFAANEPDAYRRINEIEEITSHFRRQGSGKRLAVQHRFEKDPLKRWTNRIKLVSTEEGRKELAQLFKENFISEDIALRPLSRFMDSFWRDTYGKQIPTGKRPEDIAESVRGQAAAMVAEFTWRGPLTWFRRRIPGAQSLADLAALIPGKVAQFSHYMFLKRVVAIKYDRPAEYDEDGKLLRYGGEAGSLKESTKHDPRLGGIGIVDAEVKLDQMARENPEFEAAHKLVLDWWSNVLDFVRKAGPSMEAFVKRMEYRDPGNWAPLHRILEKVEERSIQAGSFDTALGNQVSKELEGSMEPVHDVFGELTKEAARMFELGFRSKVLEIVFSMPKVPGVGQFYTIMDPDRVVAADPTISRLVKEIEAKIGERVEEEQAAQSRKEGEPARRLEPDEKKTPIGGIIAGIAKKNELDPVELFQLAVEFTRPLSMPDGDLRNIVPRVNPEGKVEFYQINNPALMRWLNQGAAPQHMNVIKAFMRWHKKAFTLGTTGARPIFVWFRNPFRDVTGALINTRTSAKIFTEWLPAWFKNMVWDIHFAAVEPAKRMKGKPFTIREQQDLFLRLGTDMATELAVDSFYGQNIAKRLTKEKGGKFTQFWDWGLNFMQALERTTRTTEQELLVAEMKRDGRLQSTEELNDDVLWDLIIAGKQVSSNFTVAGRKIREWNQYVPFMNAAIQGPRETMRAIFKMGPERRRMKLQRAFWLYTVPAIMLWLAVRDEEWYQELSVRDRASAWYVPVIGDKEEILVLPMPFEIGVAFSSIPVAMLDAYYREDPKGADWFVSDFIDGLHDSKGMVETLIPSYLPPSFTLGLELLTNEKQFWKSPIVNQSLERLEKAQQYDEYSSNLAIWMGNVAKKWGVTEGWSPKVIDHVIGSFFGRVGSDVAKLGGQGGDWMDGFTQMPFVGTQFKSRVSHPKAVDELYDAFNKRQRKYDIHKDEDEREKEVRLALRDAVRAVSAIAVVARGVPDDMRFELQRERLRIARHAMTVHAQGKVDPEARKKFADARKKYEPEKKAIRKEFADKRRRRHESAPQSPEGDEGRSDAPSGDQS